MKARVLCVVIVPVVVLGATIAFWPRSAKIAPAPGAPTFRVTAPTAFSSATSENAALECLDLQTVVEQGTIKADFSGNGREKIVALLRNTGVAPVKIQADVGQTFEAGANSVVVVRAQTVEVPPGQTAQIALQTCAPSSANKVGDAPYKLSYKKTPKLQPLLVYAADHPELSPGAIQTAALALIENLPLSAVTKFTPATGESKSRFNTDAFRVETVDVVAALLALRAMGVPDSSIAMTIDPQLKIEAMIEPLSRAAAMQYYALTAETEWEYWKSELLYGAPATRHYALYGIARFYPEIALEMLPNWARETKTNQVYRISALQALADTQRPEALPILRQLADELGADTELGRAARGAADFLGQQLTHLALKQQVVAFRSSKAISEF